VTDYPDIPPAGFRRDLVRWRQLVAPCWLARLIAGEAVAAAPARAWRLLEVGCGGLAAFERAHIPQAGYLDTGALELPPLFNKVADDCLRDLLLARGIRHDTTVILYGRSSVAAARAAHMMLYAGVADVRLLDGGFQAWRGATASGPAPPPCAAADFGVALPACPQFMTGRDDAACLPGRADAALVSIRTRSEFTGLTSGYSYIEACGEIPGALWGHAGREGDVNSMSEFQHADGRMLPAADIAAMWRAEGIHPGQQLAFYCGTGWRASLAFFYAWLMDWERISVYDGGWYEWSRELATV